MAELTELEQKFLKADALAQQGDEQAKTDAALFAGEIKRLRSEQSSKENGIIQSVMSIPAGVIESAASLASGAIATPVAGLAGLGQAAANAVGIGSTSPADRVRQIQDAGTYQPTTAAGRGITGAVAYPFEKIAQGADMAGGKVAEVTGSPAIGAAVNAGLQTIAPTLIAKGLGVVASKISPVSENFIKARKLGLSVTPSEANAGVIAKNAESFSGEPRIAKALSVKNQPVANDLIAKDLGFKSGVDMDVSGIFNNISKEGKAYQVVRGSGRIYADDQYKSALGEINKDYEIAARDFPGDNHPITALVENANRPSFDANSAISKIITLRKDAKKAFRTGDSELGRATISIANALEDQVGRHLESKAAAMAEGGDVTYAGAIKEFQQARINIAKNYEALKAMNPATGDINPQVYAKLLDKGAPLTGGALELAEMAKAFPRSLQPTGKIKSTGITAFDAGAALLSKKWPALMARPITRGIIESSPAQYIMSIPSAIPYVAGFASNPAVMAGEVAAGQRGQIEDYNSVLRIKGR